MTNTRLMPMIEGTIMAAIAIMLTLLPTNVGSSFSISLGMIPMTIYCLRRGAIYGSFSGLLWGLLHFVVGKVTYLTASQVLIEYLLAFAFVFSAGLYLTSFQKALKANHKRKAITLLILATLTGCLTRYFWHFVAGVVFWGKYALWGLNPVVFSLVMNGATCLATFIVTMIVLLLILTISPKIFIVKN